jgi:hypothetical protein
MPRFGLSGIPACCKHFEPFAGHHQAEMSGGPGISGKPAQRAEHHINFYLGASPAKPEI